MIKNVALLMVVSLLIIAFGCNRQPFYSTNKVYKKQARVFAKTLQSQPQTISTAEGGAPYWVGTTNFNMRKPNFVIIHHTAQNSCDQTLQTFTLVRTQVSAHYVICKDGTVHHMLNDYLRAWHGGVAKWGSLSDVNSASIGIELDNDGYETFSQPQLNSLLTLLDTLKTRYAIPKANFIGHGDIAPTRKNDPNVSFPWQLLADKGFGLWRGDTATVTVPPDFDALLALRIIGYDIRDTSAAKLAFKRHFLGDTTRSLSEGDKKVLFSVMKQSL